MDAQPTNQPRLHYGPLAAILGTFAAFLGSQLIAGALLGLACRLLFGWSGTQTVDWIGSGEALPQAVLIGLSAALAFGFLYWFLKQRGDSLRLIGLGKFRASAFWQAGLGFIIYIASYLLTIALAKTLIPSLNLEQQQDLGLDVSASQSVALLVFNLVIIPPLLEEVLMRGFLFGGLRTKLAFLPATIITSLLFAAAHLPEGVGGLLWIGAIDTFILSLVLCYLREKTGSLWPSIFVHAIKNSIALIYLLHIG